LGALVGAGGGGTGVGGVVAGSAVGATVTDAAIDAGVDAVVAATGEDEHAPSNNARINATANPKVMVGCGVVVAAR